jgi:hypothetical protein
MSSDTFSRRAFWVCEGAVVGISLLFAGNAFNTDAAVDAAGWLLLLAWGLLPVFSVVIWRKAQTLSSIGILTYVIIGAIAFRLFSRF